MSQSEYLSRFTPSRTDPKILEAIFVQRHKTARDAEAKIADGATSKNKYHLLYVGPRGSGKTHLVTVLFNRLIGRDDLRDRLRIAWLAEDETTTSYLKLLLRIHRALHQRYPDEFPTIEPKMIPATDERGRVTWVERGLVERLAGRALLVIVENLDSLLEGLGDEGQKQWRAFLQEKAVANTLATSQQITPDISSRSAAFHGTFRIVYLEPLDLDEAIALLTSIALKVTNRPELAALLETPTGRNRVEAIDHLTGGSHRLYIMLSEFLTRDSLDDLVRPFDELIDELTPYYQERLRSLAPQQREIVEYLARAETTVAVKIIADDLMHSHQTVSAQLKRLAEMGYVRNDRRSRESLYELAEPLMRICVEVKENGRGPIRLFVEFLRRWFSKEELESKALVAATETDRLYLRLALQEREEEVSSDFSALSLEELEQRAEAFDTFEVWQTLGGARWDQELWEPALAAYEQALKLKTDQADAWEGKGVALGNLSRLVEALESFDRAIAINPKHSNAWYSHGVTLGKLGRWPEALESFDRAIAINPKHVNAWYNHGVALGELGRLAEALESFDRAIAIEPEDANAWYNRGVAFGKLGQLVETLDSFDRAIAINPENPKAWFNRGQALYELGRWDEGNVALQHALRQLPPQSRNDVVQIPGLILLILRSSRDRDVWSHRAGQLIAIFDVEGGMAQLGEALVQSLSFVPEAKLNAEGLAFWREVWIEAGQGRDALRLPLRMFEVGMRYHESGDPEELLTLISEERSIVAQALGLSKVKTRSRAL